jgi:hypothetical protein
MKYEIIMRGENLTTSVTASVGDSSLYGDFEYVRQCLVQCLHRCMSNGFEDISHIYRDFNGQVIMVGFYVHRTGGRFGYSIRKAIKQEKFNTPTR